MSNDLDFLNEGTQEYLSKRGIYHLEVLEYKWSNDIEGYNKTPFIRFVCKDKVSGGKTSFTLWMATDNDTEKRAQLKKKLLREFFTNLECNLKVPDLRALLDCTISKSCKVVLREKERIIQRKADGKPMVVTDLDYYFSGKSSDTLRPNESKMILPLSQKMKEDFDARLTAWNEVNGGTESSSPQEAAGFPAPSNDEEEDWPF